MFSIKLILLANLISRGQNFNTGERILGIIDTSYKPIDNDRREAPIASVWPRILDDGRHWHKT
jgi:hypothetical protein